MTSNQENKSDCSHDMNEILHAWGHIDELIKDQLSIPSVTVRKWSIQDVHEPTPDEMGMTPMETNAMLILHLGYPLIQRFLPFAENEVHAGKLRLIHVFDRAYPEHKGSFSITVTDGETMHCNLCNTDRKVQSVSKMIRHMQACVRVPMDPVICIKCGANWTDLPCRCVNVNHFLQCMPEVEFVNRIEWIEEYAELVKELPFPKSGFPASGISPVGLTGIHSERFSVHECLRMRNFVNDKLFDETTRIVGPRRERLINAVNLLLHNWGRPRLPFPLLTFDGIPDVEVSPFLSNSKIIPLYPYH
jgi:hypothetical protein